ETTDISSGTVQGQFSWKFAILAGLAAGVLFAIFPRGIPWEGLTFFQPLVMGRTLPASTGTSFWPFLVHLVVAGIYGLVVASLAHRFRSIRAVLLGGAVGLCLYVVNWAVVTLLAPQLTGNELGVLWTH